MSISAGDDARWRENHVQGLVLWLARDFRKFLLIEGDTNGGNEAAASQLAQSGIVIAGAVTEPVPYKIEGEKRDERDIREKLAVLVIRLFQPEFAALEGRTWGPLPKNEVWPGPDYRQGRAQAHAVKRREKGKRIEFVADWKVAGGARSIHGCYEGGAAIGNKPARGGS